MLKNLAGIAEKFANKSAGEKLVQLGKNAFEVGKNVTEEVGKDLLNKQIKSTVDKYGKEPLTKTPKFDPQKMKKLLELKHLATSGPSPMSQNFREPPVRNLKIGR